MLTSETPAHVAQEAARHVALPEHSPLLLGTFGAEGDQRALIRLPSGTVKSVSRGDSLGPRDVVAVGDGVVVLAMAGVSLQLTMPGGRSAPLPRAHVPGSKAPPLRPARPDPATE